MELVENFRTLIEVVVHVISFNRTDDTREI
jgi:hypothetical protein